MDIKIEPEDELLLSDDSVNRLDSVNDIWFEDTLTVNKEISNLKIEDFDNDYCHKVGDPINIKKEEEDVDWKNGKHEAIDDVGPVVGVSSNINWASCQEILMELKNVKKEEEDINWKKGIENFSNTSSIKIENFKIGECSYTETTQDKSKDIKIDSSMEKESILLHKNLDLISIENDTKIHNIKKESVAEIVLAKKTIKKRRKSPRSLETPKAIHKKHKHDRSSKKVNDNKMRYKCDRCTYKCAHPLSLKNHIMKHTGERPYKCEHCAFTCRIASHLKTHLNTHSDKKPFECDVCDYKSVRSTLLKLHKLSHTGEKPFKCDVCDYKCVLMCYLKVHKMTHTGEKPYKCDLCEFKCRAYSQWKNHKMVHSGEKPFACDVCDYKTAYSHSLKLHKMKHSGKKPFVCDQCDYKCTFSYRLKKHKLIHKTTIN